MIIWTSLKCFNESHPLLPVHFSHSRESRSHIINVSSLVSSDNLTDRYWNWWVPLWSKEDAQGCQELPLCAQKATLPQPWNWATWPQQQSEGRNGWVRPKSNPGISTSALSQWGHFPCILCFHSIQCVFNVEHTKPELIWWAIQARVMVLAIQDCRFQLEFLLRPRTKPELEVVLYPPHPWAACPQERTAQSLRSPHRWEAEDTRWFRDSAPMPGLTWTLCGPFGFSFLLCQMALRRVPNSEW